MNGEKQYYNITLYYVHEIDINKCIDMALILFRREFFFPPNAYSFSTIADKPNKIAGTFRCKSIEIASFTFGLTVDVEACSVR